MRRAVASIALNISEAYGVSGGNRRVRVETALGSAVETLTALRVAEALGYCEIVSQVASLQRIVWRLEGWRKTL